MSRRAAFVQRVAEFQLGVPEVGLLPAVQMPEFALVGRSNVGKSSLVNRLLGKKGLARVSDTPGKTTELNLYRVIGEDAAGKGQEFRLVDLPGFGFAKFSAKERVRIGALTEQYIREREQLKVVLLLNDSKRAPEDDERYVQQVCADAAVNLLVIVTKMDRLNQKERRESLKKIAAGFRLEETDLIPAGEGQSVDAIWSRVLPLLGS